MDEIALEFKEESLGLVQDLIQILEDLEEDASKNQMLEDFGQKVDRIMGSAKTMVMAGELSGDYELIGNYAELCKKIGYKGSQISNNQELVNITVGLLFDAVETLEKLIQSVGTETKLNKKEVISLPFLERLKWLSTQFSDDLRSSLAVSKESVTPEGSQGFDEVLLKFFKS